MNIILHAARHDHPSEPRFMLNLRRYHSALIIKDKETKKKESLCRKKELPKASFYQ